MTTWQSQYIPEGDSADPEGWYVRTEWDTADEVRMVLGVHSEEEAVRVAEYLNAIEPSCSCEYPYPPEIWRGHHPTCELEHFGYPTRKGPAPVDADKVWQEARDQVEKELGRRG